MIPQFLFSCYSNNIDRGVIAAKSDNSINSELFVSFMKELVIFIKEREGCSPKNCLLILDNASVHRAETAKHYM